MDHNSNKWFVLINQVNYNQITSRLSNHFLSKIWKCVEYLMGKFLITALKETMT